MQVQKARHDYKLVKSLFGKYQEIPEDWNFNKLEGCCDILDSRRIPLNSDERKKIQGDVPYYGANGVLDHVNKHIFDENLVLLAEDGGYFDEYQTRPIAQYVTGKIWVNNHAHVLKNRIGYDLKFIYYSLVHKNIVPWINGSTRSKLNQSELREIKIIMPSLENEQQKIASILSNIDSLINQTQKEIEQTQRLKKGLMQKFLTKGIGHTKFKEYVFTNHGIISLGTIPEKWNVKTVRELEKENYIIEFQDGNHGELHPKTKDFTEKGKPFLTASQIDENGNILLSKCKRLPEHFWTKLRIGFSQAKDVLFTHNATVGRVAVLPENFPDCIVGTSVTYYRLNEDEMNRFYFGYILRSNFIKKQYSTEMDQTTRQQFSILKQAKLKIPLPNLGEQKKIASILSNVDSKIQQQQEYKSQLEILKKSLMQKLLTGQIRVKV